MISFRLVNGRRIDLEKPTVEDIDVNVIACGLSKICRFTGQLRDFYSVAQHSIMVAEIVDRPLRFAALHHDDTEAYLNDLSRNLKHSIYLGGYRQLENAWTQVVMDAFNIKLTAYQHARMKVADDLMAIFENVVLRDRQQWDAPFHIAKALREGFVGPGVEPGLRRNELESLAHNIPAEWHDHCFMTLTHEQAEHKFIERHCLYARGQ